MRVDNLERIPVGGISYPKGDYFFHLLAQFTEQYWTDDPNVIDTACTDGKRIIFNRQWMESLTPLQRSTTLRHELKHIFHNHPARLLEKDPLRWNLACDMVINTEDVGDKNWDYPPCWLLPDEWAKKKPSAEQVYDWLEKEGEELLKAAIAGGFKPDMLAPSPDAQLSAASAVKQAAEGSQHYRSAGRAVETPYWAEKILRDHRSINWQSVLGRLLSAWVRGGSTWERPNRRFIGNGLYLPSPERKGMNFLYIGVDVSSSMPENTVRAILGDIQLLRKAVEIERMRLRTFNYSLREEHEIPRHRSIPERVAIGGGTQFEPVLAEIEAMKPDAAIILTDGEASFKEAFQYPHEKLFWVIYDSDIVPPYGKTFFANGR